MFKLIAATAPVDNAQPRVWQDRTANFVRPTELAFLVFEINIGWDWLEYLAGLQVQYTETGYIVAGTVEQWLTAATHYGDQNHPHDIRKFYGYVLQKIRDFGYKVPT